MHTILAPLACLTLVALPALADTLVATRPGLGCKSLEALAALTLPDGSSRVGTPRERPADAGLKLAGGCVDIPAGATAVLQKSWQHMALVTIDAGNGRQLPGLTVPIIDFSPAPAHSVTDQASPQAGVWRKDGDTYVWVPGR